MFTKVIGRLDRFLKRHADWKRYVLELLIVAGILFGLYICTIKLPIGEILLWATPFVFDKGWAPVRYGTSHFINLLTIVGMAATSVGIYMTYSQMKESFDRIETYSQLFDAIDLLISEIEKKKAHEFYFYGSNLLPGIIASADKKRVEELKGNLACLFGLGKGASEIEHNIKIRILLPDNKKVEELFNLYNGKTIAGRNVAITSEVCNAAFLEAESVVKEATWRGRTNVKFRRTKESDSARGFEAEYFFCNGIRSVHVLALHYRPKDTGEGITPTLLGVNTRDATILNSLKGRFYGFFDAAENKYPVSQPLVGNEQTNIST